MLKVLSILRAVRALIHSLRRCYRVEYHGLDTICPGQMRCQRRKANTDAQVLSGLASELGINAYYTIINNSGHEVGRYHQGHWA